jgi:transcriptional regulator with XRE-family HTH domain
MDLGTRISAWLKVRGMTQKDLAVAVGVSPAAVTAWVKGEYAPGNGNLEAIATALDVTMERFYGRIPKAKVAASA